MKKRRTLSRSKSKKLFANTAKKVHPKNTSGRHVRGGIRL